MVVDACVPTALLLMVVIANVSLRLLKKMSLWFYLAGLAMLVAVIGMVLDAVRRTGSVPAFVRRVALRAPRSAR